jgi:hypothetical protein
MEPRQQAAAFVVRDQMNIGRQGGSVQGFSVVVHVIFFQLPSPG